MERLASDARHCAPENHRALFLTYEHWPQTGS
jgi:hypothetical protein